jgi:glycosyltransferase involved in cell wall biosynthesis
VGSANAEAALPARSTAKSGVLLLVANYRPDVGYAWWLMENFWIQFAAVASKRGLTPVIAYPTHGTVPDNIQKAGIQTIVLPVPTRGWSGLFAALRFMVRHRVHTIYFTDRQFTSFHHVLYRVAGVRWILNHDHTPGDRPPVRGLKGFLKAVWRRLPLASCDLQICVSPLIRERAVHNARIPARKTAVVQNGIRPFDHTMDPTYARTTFGLPDDSILVVTVGRAHPYKRIDFVIEAAACHIRRYPDSRAHFVYCGDGPDMPRLRALARQKGLEGRFIFAGNRSDVDKILCSSHIAVHAAQGEAFSLAVLEYMSAGLAVLVPDIPSVSQAVRHGVSGIIYRDGDSEGVAEELSRLIAEPARREALGGAARAEVIERYSFTQMNEAFTRLVSRYAGTFQTPVASPTDAESLSPGRVAGP